MILIIILSKHGMIITNNQDIHKCVDYMKSNVVCGGTNIDKTLRESINMIKYDIELVLQTDDE